MFIAIVKWDLRLGYTIILKLPPRKKISQDTLSLVFFRAFGEERRRKDTLYGTIKANTHVLSWYSLGGFFSDPHVVLVESWDESINYFIAMDLATKYRRQGEKIINLVDSEYLSRFLLLKVDKRFLIPLSLSDEYRCKIFSLIMSRREMLWENLLEDTTNLHPVPSSDELEEHITILNIAGLLSINYSRGRKIIRISIIPEPIYLETDCNGLVDQSTGSSRGCIDEMLYKVSEVITNPKLRRRILELKKSCKSNYTPNTDALLEKFGVVMRLGNTCILRYLPALILRDIKGNVLYKISF